MGTSKNSILRDPLYEKFYKTESLGYQNINKYTPRQTARDY